MLATIEIQRTLYRLGFLDGGVDGLMGPKTRAAVAAWASARCIDPADAGKVEAELVHEAATMLPQFIEARNYNRGGMLPIKLIVIHTAEAPEIHREAQNVAGWFAQQPVDGTVTNGVKFGGSSAHYIVDDDGVVQCVLECDRAWHAGSVNPFAIGIEHAGYASQTPDQWADDYSKAVLANSAGLVAKLCKRFSVPAVRLEPYQVAAGAMGICGHCDVNDAFGKPGAGHRDPGANFPWTDYIAAVVASMTDEAA